MKIEQYLPMYIGQKARMLYPKKQEWKEFFVTPEFLFQHEQLQWETKLILRPLSSMTEEEWEEMFKLPGMALGASSKDLWMEQFDQFADRPKAGFGKKWQNDHPGEKVPTEKVKVVSGLDWNYYTYSPSALLWLLSRGFDIFGLKEKGLCLYPEEL